MNNLGLNILLLCEQSELGGHYYRSIKMKKWLLALSLLGAANVALACTAVNITAKDGTVIAGRTMEWAYDMKWQINSMPAGTTFEMSGPAALKLPTLSQKTKYALIGISPAVLPGPPALLEGQNSAGMSMSANFLPGFTEYPKVTTTDKFYVSVLEFGTMTLGMFGTVDEIKKELPKYKVWYDSSLPAGPTPPWLHFVFTDKTGASVIVEFVGGEMRLHENVASVLTNSPAYQWQVTNLRNYLSLSNFARPSIDINGQNVAEIGQGGGLMGLPADYTPPSRFVRTAYLRHFSDVPQTREENVQLVAHILNNVDIPKGVAASKDGGKVVSDYTQWVAIKDLTNSQWHITDYQNRTTYVTIDLQPLFQSGKAGAWLVDDLPYPTPNVTQQLLK
jgi:penicillin V acylase-like amidase (Ntn superfamily)